ncbi:retinol-binding protein pinta isoform X1 [Camponotus floridanus]|uniref:retinol-binding protein pinta isoform X1 n=1 Tax=Camponotus floridanus TaxID=104421 RepID=UPI000DC6CFF1|nr:retinol-binding protein pinta isoform X1 [Camponotus floridanus]
MAKIQNCDSSILKLTTEQKEYAAKVLNEHDENRETAIVEIKRWIQENDLRARTDDLFILRFLRACKFNLEKTKTKIRNYQMQRAKMPEWYGNRDPLQPKLQELLDLGICLPLRKLDNEGRMIILARVTYNPDIFALADVFKVSSMSIDLALRDSVEASLYGLVIIIDSQYATLRHIAQVRPGFLMNIVHMWQGCYPIRIQLLNYVNTPEFTKFIMMLTRYFLSDKLKQRLHVYTHKTTHECFTNIPANILPVEYGGTDGTIQELTEYWKKTVEENRDWFIDDENYKPVL